MEFQVLSPGKKPWENRQIFIRRKRKKAKKVCMNSLQNIAHVANVLKLYSNRIGYHGEGMEKETLSTQNMASTPQIVQQENLIKSGTYMNHRQQFNTV
jgi:hypothetical protein